MQAQEQFGVIVTKMTMSRVLRRRGMTRKTVRHIAAQRTPALRHHWHVRLSDWTASQLVFVDESGADEKTAQRRWGWAPEGQPAEVTSVLKRSARWSVLPAYTVDGYIAHMVIQGSINATIFNTFLQNSVLPLCNAYPGPRSVLVMDTASIHHSKVCWDTIVNLVLSLQPHTSPRAYCRSWGLRLRACN